MKRIMNFCTHSSDLERFESGKELRGYYRRFGLDGLELLEAGPDDQKLVAPEDVVGVHLKYFPSWYCFWSGDERTIAEEFGSREEAEQYFGGTGQEAVLEAFRKNLEFARRYHPEYVVFHVSDVLLSEAVPRKFRYSDEEIVDAAADLLNRLLPENEGFELLLENLWWPGLTMTRPEVTYRLLEKVRYPRKGIMLDTGHLLHTNTALRTEQEGAAYLREVMERYEDQSIIRGIHFHQTLSGAYVEEQKKHPPVMKGSYDEKNGALAWYVWQVDSHRPFLCREAWDVVEWLNPEYLVYELLTEDRAEHERFMEALCGTGNRSAACRRPLN